MYAYINEKNEFVIDITYTRCSVHRVMSESGNSSTMPILPTIPTLSVTLSDAPIENVMVHVRSMLVKSAEENFRALLTYAQLYDENHLIFPGVQIDPNIPEIGMFETYGLEFTYVDPQGVILSDKIIKQKSRLSKEVADILGPIISEKRRELQGSLENRIKDIILTISTEHPNGDLPGHLMKLISPETLQKMSTVGLYVTEMTISFRRLTRFYF